MKEGFYKTFIYWLGNFVSKISFAILYECWTQILDCNFESLLCIILHICK